MIEHELVVQNADIRECYESGCVEDGFPCYLPDSRDEPDGYYCPTHAFNNGFCKMCGCFEGGIESFEFGPYAGYCDICKVEMEHIDHEDDDDWYDDDPMED